MKRVSIRDVAKAAGVSITTISKALNNYPDVNPDTRKRIQDLAKEMNYVPDSVGRIMGGFTERVIGLLINDLQPSDPSGAVFGTLSGVCAACNENNVSFMLLTTDPDTQKRIPLSHILNGKRLSGLICCGFSLGEPYLEQMEHLDIPCAVIDMVSRSSNVISIAMDDTAAAEKAVALLLETGHRNIALINGTESADVSVRRGQGYRNALNRFDVKVRYEWVRDGGFDEDVAYAQADELLRNYPELDGFFCASDLMAFGVCRAIEEAGRKPGEDIAVVGFDDIPTARFLHGGLTTVRQNFYERGYRAGDIIYRWIRDGKRPENCAEDTYELVIRGTASQEMQE